jgi:thymidylate synthase
MYYKSYNNSQQALEDLYEYIMQNGITQNNTKAIHNVCLNILNPYDNEINTPWRKWNKNYAEYEWLWYLSGDRNATEISQKAKIWQTMMDDNNNVNSNYGYQWNRNDQLEKVINMLRDDPKTRRASVSIYDGKEIDLYAKDTPCTYAINFYVDHNGNLSMQVMMRSNDLIYGFCNDQYCFSELMKYVANKLNLKHGNYFHYVCNMHIYERHFNIKNKHEIL